MQIERGQVAVVTGAGSGIGLGIARAFASEGLAVALLDRRAERLASAAEQVEALGGRALPLEVDVADAGALSTAADAIEAAFGRIDIICNNAGVLVRGKGIEDVTPLESAMSVLDVNFYGTLNGINVFVPRIRKHGRGGHIVNTASIGGFEVSPVLRTGPYDVTKFAIVGLTEALANDLAGTNIGVTVFATGRVRDRDQPLARDSGGTLRRSGRTARRAGRARAKRSSIPRSRGGASWPRSAAVSSTRSRTPRRAPGSNREYTASSPRSTRPIVGPRSDREVHPGDAALAPHRRGGQRARPDAAAERTASEGAARGVARIRCYFFAIRRSTSTTRSA